VEKTASGKVFFFESQRGRSPLDSLYAAQSGPLDVTFYNSDNRCAGFRGKKKHKNSKFVSILVSILAAVSWSLGHCRLKEYAPVRDPPLFSVSLETLLAIALTHSDLSPKVDAVKASHF
jgi:hypothetical protein